MKKTTFFFLCMLLPMVANAFNGNVEINGLWFKIVSKINAAELIQIPEGKYSGDIVIPEFVEYDGLKCSVIAIGDQAFDGCSDLTSVTIPKSVTNIGIYAFRSCESLKSVHISDLAAWCNIDFGNNPLVYAHHLFLNDVEIKELNIPNSANAIKASAFSGCSGLTSVNIPVSVMSIGEYAFKDCSGLTSINIPNNLTTINKYVFSGCSSLTSIIIPNTVTQISDYAFQGCSGLTSLSIPSSVTSLGMSTFSGCSSLKSIIIPNSLTTIPHSCFWGCSSLSSINIPNSVTDIKTYAFRKCENMTTVTIPKSVKYLHEEAFGYCPELTDVYCYAENIPESYYPIFTGSEIKYATLHVPNNSIYRYSNDINWKGFGTYISIESELLPQCEKPIITYKDGFVCFSCDTPGVTFVPKVEFIYNNEDDPDKINLSSNYIVKVYATREGYRDSEVATKEVTPGKFGDLNNDGEVNVADHVKLSDIIMNK